MARKCKVNDVGVEFIPNKDNVTVEIVRPFAKEVCVWCIHISWENYLLCRDEITHLVKGVCASTTAYIRAFALEGIEKMYS